ncbi:hypothetical protein ACFL0Q_05680 [Thermodesulfobacteriota bacterium]
MNRLIRGEALSGFFFRARKMSEGFGACLFVALFLLAVWGQAGCGKKGPPVPRLRSGPPSIQELKALREGDRVVLTWKCASEFPPSGVLHHVILRGALAMGESECPACRPVFQKVATMSTKPPVWSPKDGKAAYVDRVKPGYRYVYKVRVQDGQSGHVFESPTVMVVYPR